jgi:hypothetical protein
MNVKGTVFITSKAGVIVNFGEDKWNAFITKLGAKDSYFKNVIMSVTLIPVDKFIIFLDEMLKEFFDNDPTRYIFLGRVAAKFALSPGGLYHSYLLKKDVNQFIEKGMPQLWNSYYDEGEVKGWVDKNIAHIKITGIPVKHVYFEYLNMGYVKQALKIFGIKTNEKCVRGVSKGDNDIYYQFELLDS